MKIFSLTTALIFSLFIFMSCQKTDSGTGQSAGTLKADSSLECLQSVVKGKYFADSFLTAENFIDVQVNLTRAGTYSIQSDNVNGYNFKDSGRLGTLGINTVRLYGSGKPEHAGTDHFLVRYGSSYCVLDVDVDQAGIQAAYTFEGAGSTCAGAVLNGVYSAGQQTNTTNTATIAIAITSPGNFFIATTEINGITFSGEGVFTDTSQPSVLLTAHGTPLSSGTFNYPLIGDGTSCAFSITFL